MIAAASFALGAAATAAALLPPPGRWLAALIAVASAALLWRAAWRRPPPPPAVPSRHELIAALAAGLAHELGQPLTAATVDIQGLHYLKQLGRVPPPEYLDRVITRVGMNLLAMGQIIDHLRALATHDQLLPLERADLGEAVERILAQRERWLAQQEIAIDWRRPKEPQPALVHPTALQLVLVNLLRNAVEAVVELPPARRRVRIAIERRGQQPAVTVRDEGPGIPAEQLERIFDPFVSVKGPGRGIGLFLAKVSAERMGASLVLESRPEQGTTAVLTLQPPLAGS